MVSYFSYRAKCKRSNCCAHSGTVRTGISYEITVQTCSHSYTFRRKVFPQSSGSKCKSSKKQARVIAGLYPTKFLLGLLFSPEVWNRCSPETSVYRTTRQCIQKTVLFSREVYDSDRSLGECLRRLQDTTLLNARCFMLNNIPEFWRKLPYGHIS
jgi:hypothetical protein